MPSAELISTTDNVALIRVSFDPEQVNQAFGRVYKDLGKNLRVPGFRQGKVPPNIIRQRVGLEHVTGEAGDRLKEAAVQFALAELSLTPRFGSTKWEAEPDPVAGQGLVYEFALPVLPQVTIPDYASYDLTINVPLIDDELRQRYKNRVLQQFTEVNEKEGPAGQGDMIVIGIHSKFAESGEESPFGGHGINYIIGREGNLPGWDEHFIGRSKGESIDFEYTLPDDYGEEEVAGKHLSLHVHLDSVQSVNEAELNEGFVKEKLHMGSLDEFEGFVENALRREVASQLSQNKAEAVMRRVVDELQAELTEDMVSEEIDGLLQQQDEELRGHGLSIDRYLKDNSKTIAEHRESLRAPAEGKIKFFLAVKAISDSQNFEVSRDDYMRYAYYVMQREGLDGKQMKDILNDRRFINEATYQVIREKVLNHVVESAKFTVNDPNGVIEEQPPAAADFETVIAEAASGDMANAADDAAAEDERPG